MIFYGVEGSLGLGIMRIMGLGDKTALNSSDNGSALFGLGASVPKNQPSALDTEGEPEEIDSPPIRKLMGFRV